MPLRKTFTFSDFGRKRLLTACGVDGGQAVLTTLDTATTEAVIAGPGAKPFALHFVQELLGLGGRALIRIGIAAGSNGGKAKDLEAEWITELSELRRFPERLTIPPRTTSEIEQYEAYLSWSRSTSFAKYRAADLLGMKLSYQQQGGSDLLSRQISFADFVFTTEEYLSCQEKIKLTQRLYPKVGQLPMAFQALNAGIFRHQSLEDGQAFISDQVTRFITEAKDLHERYLQATNRFYQRRRNWYKQSYATLSIKLQKMISHRKVLALELGEEALTAVPSRLAAGLSRKGKKLRQEIISIYDDLADLAQTHQSLSPFDFNWPEKATAFPQEQWPALLADYELRLEKWFDEHRQLIREECLGLSPRTVAHSSSQAAILSKLEQESQQLVNTINDSGLFQRPFAAQAGTTTRQQKMVEQLLETMHELQQLLPVFPTFYRWQYNWFSLPAKLRRVVAPLLLLPEHDWATLFSSWYFEQGLYQKRSRKVERPSPKGVSQLVEKITLARTHLTNDKKDPIAKHQLLIEPLDQIVDTEQFDVILTVGSALPEIETTIPQIRLLTTGHESEQRHWLSRYGNFEASLAFFQEWAGRQFPNWEAIPYAAAWKKAKKSILEKLGVAIEAPSLDTTTLVGIRAGHPNRCLPFRAYTGSYFDEVVVLLSLDEITPKQLPTAEHWMSLLLNVPKVSVHHQCSNDVITQALLSDGMNTAYGMAAFLRAAEAIADNDSESFRAIAAENRSRLGLQSVAASPLLSELRPPLRQELPGYQLHFHYPWRGIFFPIFVLTPGGKRHVVLLDGVLPGTSETISELYQQQEIISAGFQLHYLFTDDLLNDFSGTIDRLVQALSATTH